MSKEKRLVLSDSSLNRYGYRVLTEGCQNLEAFKKNPVLLYMHFRDEGAPEWCDYKAIGHWEDIRIDGDQLSAVPVFDCVDELSQTVAKKFEAGTFNAASIGLRILATSEEKEYLLPDQTRATVTKWDILEASIVDIPANQNAVRLYSQGAVARLAASTDEGEMPALLKKHEEKMNLKKTWKTVLAFLGIAEDKAESTQLSVDNVESLDSELNRLQQEVATLSAESATLKTENGNLKSSIATKDAEIVSLKNQVENLKKKPVEAPLVKPANEPSADNDDLAAFSADESNDTIALAEKMEKEGL